MRSACQSLHAPRLADKYSSLPATSPSIPYPDQHCRYSSSVASLVTHSLSTTSIRCWFEISLSGGPAGLVVGKLSCLNLSLHIAPEEKFGSCIFYWYIAAVNTEDAKKMAVLQHGKPTDGSGGRASTMGGSGDDDTDGGDGS